MLFSSLFRAIASFLRPARRLGPMAEDVAKRCRKNAGKRVRNILGGMTTPEARGYIRARAGDLIQDQVSQVVFQPRLGDQERAELIHQATNILVTMVLRDWLAARPALAQRRAA